MATIYVPDELKARLVAAAEKAGFTVTRGAGSELASFLEQLISTRVPLSGDSPAELWQGFRNQIDPLLGTLSKALRPYRVGLNVAFTPEEGQLLVYQQPLEDEPKTVRQHPRAALTPDAMQAFGFALTDLFHRLGGYDYEPQSLDEAKLVWAALEEALEILGGQSATSRALAAAGHGGSRLSSLSIQGLAEQLIDRAWSESGHPESIPTEHRQALAHFVLRLDPDCTDAYTTLGIVTEEKGDLEQARLHYRRAIRAARHTLGAERFAKEHRGEITFWYSFETRPFMRALALLAGASRELGHMDAAVHYYRTLLALQPNDPQGNRYCLAACFLQMGRLDDLQRLLQKHREPDDAQWRYNWAALLFLREGATRAANDALRKAFAANPHVPNYLAMEQGELPESSTYSPASPEEAAGYAHLAGRAWRAAPEAFAWLTQRAKHATLVRRPDEIFFTAEEDPDDPVHRWAGEAFNLLAPLVTEQEIALKQQALGDGTIRLSEHQRQHGYRVRGVLTTLAPLLPRTYAMRLVTLIDHIALLEDFIEVAVAFLPVAPGQQQHTVFVRAYANALMTMRQPADLGYRDRLGEVLAVTPADLLKQVKMADLLAYIKAHDPARRGIAVCSLAPYLDAEALTQVMPLAREVAAFRLERGVPADAGYPYERVAALLAIAARLRGPDQARLVDETRPYWAQALSAAWCQAEYGFREDAVRNGLFQVLSRLGYTDVVKAMILESPRSSDQPFHVVGARAQVLASLAHTFPSVEFDAVAQDTQDAVLRELKRLSGGAAKLGAADALSRLHVRDGVDVAACLLGYVSHEKTRATVAATCLDVIHKLVSNPRSRTEADEQADALQRIAPMLPPAQAREGLAIAQSLYTRPSRARALSALLPSLRDKEREKTRAEVEEIAGSLRDPLARAEALTNLAYGYRQSTKRQ